MKKKEFAFLLLDIFFAIQYPKDSIELKCLQCQKHFSHEGYLKTHKRSHNGEKLFKCSKCKKSFSESGHLKKHTIVYKEKKIFHCFKCEEYSPILVI